MLAIELFGHRVDPREHTLLDGYPRNAMGLELEWDDCYLSDRDTNRLRFWERHQEGSLSNRGAELTFAQPYRGIDVKNALAELEPLANKVVRVDSPNHSTHCHVDCRDLTVNELIHFIIGAIIVEPILFSRFGHGREENIFCLSSAKSMGSYTVEMGEVLASLQLGRVVVGNSTLDMRYNGINYGALEKFGSIEFRHGHVMYDIDMMLEFMNFLDNLKEYCRVDIDPFKDYEEFIQRIISEYYDGQRSYKVGKMVAVVELMLESMWNSLQRRKKKRKLIRARRPVLEVNMDWLTTRTAEEILEAYPMRNEPESIVPDIPSNIFSNLFSDHLEEN